MKLKKQYKIIIVVVILFLFLFKPVKSIIQLKMKGYDIPTSYRIYKLGIRKEVLDKDYSETLEDIIDENKYKKEYLESYFDINYYEDEDFITNVALWLDLGYNKDDINNINKKEDKDLNKKVSDNFIKDISSYIEYNFFKTDKLERYISFFNGDYRDTVVKVNIGLDKAFFEDPNVVNTYSVDMIVNKYNKLSEEFVPTDLTKLDNCSEGEEYLSKDAKEAYDKLCEASLESGLHLGVTSSYRSYEDQVSIYNSYLKSKGQDYVDKYVATPGFSEHQTGLALDVKSTVASPFVYTKEYKWMVENAYKYGFILRYPENLENITGYNNESWHFRYVGEEIANYIQENGITYDEYYAIFM